ncbi:MAG: dehydrogenase [Planctomycetota bacterium]|nr:MAG: dehydrogenase [Planctomycetota bacterium]REK21343.1 MAG: dehydrogenase [Planctomycetota bacterium]REK35699.1 MAG: dehydrogenase [Planctomycetota bacterium]
MPRTLRVLSLLLITATLALGVRISQSTQADEPSLADELPRIPATEPADVMDTFEIQHGFQLELVAHEPLVADPVDACFDEQGRLYVAEMHGYPYSEEVRAQQPEPIGKVDAGVVRLLEDTDGDGVFDESWKFAEGISWPTSVCCYDGGVFVIAPEKLWYFKDTDGDHVADVREIVFTGLSRANVQGLANNLKWGLDNRIYASGGTNSDSVLTRDGEEVGSLRGRNFAFDPKTGEVEFLTGGRQFGHSFDDFGNAFVCSNSNHIQHIVFPIKYINRTPGVTVSGAIRTIAAEGAAAPVYRKSPAEPWRIVRTRRRAADPNFADRAPATELVATGFFTSATGVTIYRGDAYPEPFRGNAFIGDVGGNLVHRKTLAPNGVTFTATRADQDVEFITSTDNWFRPVNFVNGPDGCLYILDMYRETIEHPFSIPEDIKQHLDLESGDDRGRIYRIAPPEWKQKPFPNLAEMNTSKLVDQLNSTNAWNRVTAQRLLWEQQDQAAVEPLHALVENSTSDTARVHALYTLDGLGALTQADLFAALDPPDPRVAEQAVLLAEKHHADFPGAGEILFRAIAEYPEDARVQFQVAFSLGEFDEQTTARGLALLASNPNLSSDVQQAMLTSVGNRGPQLVTSLLARSDLADGEVRWLQRLAELITVNGGAPDVVNALTDMPDGDRRAAVAAAVLQSVARGLTTRGNTLSQLAATDDISDEARAIVSASFATARASALDADAQTSTRAAAVTFLSHDETENLIDLTEQLLTPQQPQAIQSAVVRAVSDHPGAEVTAGLLESWAATSPAVRIEIIDALLRSQARTEQLFAAIEAGDVKPGEIAADKRQALLSHPVAAVRGLAEQHFGVADADRAKVIADYEPALEEETNAERGVAVFKKVCANCHKVGEEGHAVGPDLASVVNKSPRDLLIAMLDPNREAQPNFTNYSVLLEDGRIVTGIIVDETADTLTLRRAEGKEDVILRNQIEELRSTGLSLMPVGLEKDITPEQMADVIAFIKSIPPKEAGK